MYSALKIFNNRQKSESGFVLIAALMAVMIIIAVSFFILTTTTQDIRTSSRLVGERKAFSAAESGMQTFCLTFNPGMAPVLNQPVDAVNDPTARFDIPTTPARNIALPDIPAQGSDIKGGVDWVYQIWDANIVGRDTAYSSSVTFSVGTKFGPVPNDPSYK